MLTGNRHITTAITTKE